MRKSEAETPLRLPVKLDTATNGEYVPAALPLWIRCAKTKAMVRASENARRLGQTRR